MTIPIPERRANCSEIGGEASLTHGFGSFLPAEGSPWSRRVVRFGLVDGVFRSKNAKAAAPAD